MDSLLTQLSYLVEPERKYNIWTIRLTPYPLDNIDEKVVFMFDDLPDSKFPRYVVFKEKSRSGKLHYHVRICCTGWATRKSLSDWIPKHFPNQSGNALFSTKKVLIKGKEFSSLRKSFTYIAKDCDCLTARGYSQEDIALMIDIGSKWKLDSSAPIYKKIIRINNIHSNTSGHVVTKNILQYYEKENKPIPSYHQLTKILHLIKYAVDPAYRTCYADAAARHYDNLVHHVGL